MFSKNGFEIYEDIKKTYPTQELFKEIDTPIKKKL